ncbi:hypothetical protein ACIA78_12675 [Streptomyces xanthochromogenes]|uniref:hypothetical protein n=1 Tax=Streptomyces xanthochromogenes TaxID=67384 RepID=UPI0037A404EC
MRRILYQPLAAVLTAGEPPVVFEEQVCADYLDEVQQSFRTRPASFFRIERIPEAEGVVARVPVLGRGSRLGVNAWEVLRQLAVGRVGRVLVEADLDVDRIGFACDVESGEFVRQ